MVPDLDFRTIWQVRSLSVTDAHGEGILKGDKKVSVTDRVKNQPGLRVSGLDTPAAFPGDEGEVLGEFGVNVVEGGHFDFVKTNLRRSSRNVISRWQYWRG